MYASMQWNQVYGNDKVELRWEDDSLYLTVDGPDTHLVITGMPGHWQALMAKIGAHLQDRQMQAHPETCCDGTPILQIDDETPMGEGELLARKARGEDVSDEEIVRRAGF